MNNIYQDVLNFNNKFEVPLADKPQLLNDELYNYRLGFMREELQEFVDAQYQQNLQQSLDALIDLIYVAAGTAQMMGVDYECWSRLWNTVQEANMNKVRAKSAAESKRGNSVDVIKPEGWNEKWKPDAKQVLILNEYLG